LSQAFLETIFESSYDGIYITDGNAVTIMVNKSYEFITGLRREEMLGQSMRDLVERRVISQSGTLAALERREPVTLEQRFRTGKHATITSTPIFDKDNQIVMVVTNVRDVTELRSLQKELEESKARNLQYYKELESLRQKTGKSIKLTAESPTMKETLRVADKVADLDVPILLEGESGSGKQALARYIVSKSRRRNKKFIEVNCSTYAEGMLERELFGVETSLPSEPGSPGLFELVDGGTILLQDVGELSDESQIRLTRLLQDHLLVRIGSSKPSLVDVRVLASTSVSLAELTKAKKFREGLYYCLNVLPIRIPPLRQRREDILPLVYETCVQVNKKYRQKKRFTPDALQALQSYSWPGNLRELKNAVESAMILCNGNVITPQDLPIFAAGPASKTEAVDPSGVLDLRSIVKSVELRYIRRAYQKYGNVRDAARSLSMDPSTFVRKRKKLEGQLLE